MSIEMPVFTQKHLKHLIRQLLNQQRSVVSYAPGSDLFQEVMASLGPSPQFLIDEVVYKAVKTVVNEDCRIDLNDQPDFFSYGEKKIKLPEMNVVRVDCASIDHMLIQKQTLLDNHIKQIRGFLRHHDGIVVPIIRTMEERGLRTAGEALLILQGES
jgi:hypothetical protein